MNISCEYNFFRLYANIHEEVDFLNLSTSLFIVLPIFIYIGIKLYLNSLERKKAKKIFNEFETEKMKAFDSSANFFGFKSNGFKQIKGNGILVLTEKEIVFERWLPEKRFTISVESIENVEETNSFLGKTKGDSLLKIDFLDEKGNLDSCAWQVNDLEQWETDLTLVKNKF